MTQLKTLRLEILNPLATDAGVDNLKRALPMLEVKTGR